MLDFLQQKFGALKNKHITVLGLAFKPNVDDLRESPAIEVAHLMVEAGAEVCAYEPYKLDFHLDKVKMAQSLEEAVKDAELIVLLVGHDQFKGLNPQALVALTTARKVLDTVNALDAANWEQTGFTLLKL